MLARDLISHDVFPLKKNDTVEAALLFMEDWRVFDLPVVDNGKVIGYCEFTDLMETAKKDKITPFIKQEKIHFVQAYQHLFEIIKLFSEQKLNVIAVVEQDNFVGLLTGQDLLAAYKQSALSQPGGIIELQMPARNYSLSEISRLVESNDAKIIHLFVKSLEDENGHIEVSIKLNTQDLKNVISTLERYQYQIVGVYQATATDDNFQSRFQNLIKYLNT